MPATLEARLARNGRSLGLIAAVAASLLLGACAQSRVEEGIKFNTGSLADDGKAQSEPPQTELQKAIEYWGKQYAKNPTNAEAAVNYARNLKAAGHKERALVVLQQASMSAPDSKTVASEYGRLALEMDQVVLASQLLAAAEDPARPDWRVLSAQGAALAKQGRHKDALGYFERARELAPDRVSVLNNLALGYAMDGQAEKAEQVFRQIPEDQANTKVRQNLALILGLQGKYSDARRVAGEVQPPELVNANMAALQQMTGKVEQKAAATATEPAIKTASIKPAAQKAAVQKAAKAAAEQDAYWAKIQATAQANQVKLEGR